MEDVLTTPGDRHKRTAHLPFQLCWSFLCPLAIAKGQLIALDSPVYPYMTLLYTPDPKVYSVMSVSFFHYCLHEYICFQNLLFSILCLLIQSPSQRGVLAKYAQCI